MIEKSKYHEYQISLSIMKNKLMKLNIQRAIPFGSIRRIFTNPLFFLWIIPAHFSLLFLPMPTWSHFSPDTPKKGVFGTTKELFIYQNPLPASLPTTQNWMVWLSQLMDKAPCWAIEMWIFCHFGYHVKTLSLYGHKKWWSAYSGLVLDEDNTSFIMFIVVDNFLIFSRNFYWSFLCVF